MNLISLEECRQGLSPDCHMTDEELDQLREQLYTLAQIGVTAFLRSGGEINNPNRLEAPLSKKRESVED